MKRRVTILGILAFFAILGFYACSSSTTDEQTLEVSIVSGSTVEKEGGTATIEVKSNSDWTVSVNQNWATPSVTSGQNDATFNVAIPVNDGTSSRSVTVTVRVSDALQRTVTITQRGDEPESETLTISITSGNPVGADGGTVVIGVQSNTSWEVTSSESWATINPQTGENNGDFNVVVPVYGGENDRNTTITVQTASRLVTRTVTITQSGTPIPEGPITVSDLVGEWEVIRGYIGVGEDWYIDAIDGVNRTLTISMENEAEKIIRIHDLSGVTKYFDIGDYDDYVLATVDEENRTLRIHAMVELAPLDPIEYPDTVASTYIPLIHIDAAGNNIGVEWPDMPISGNPGNLSVDLATSIDEAGDGMYYTYLFCDLEEENEGFIFGGGWLLGVGQIITQTPSIVTSAKIPQINDIQRPLIRRTIVEPLKFVR